MVPQHAGSQGAGLARLRDVWWEATTIRQEWLGHGLCTEPADRSAAEHHLTAIYARLGRARPEFVWVDSPARAIPLVAGGPTLDQVYAWIHDRRPRARPPLASDLAMVAAQLRAGLSAGVAHADPELAAVRKGKQREPWPERPPLDALEEGIPLGVVRRRFAAYWLLIRPFSGAIRRSWLAAIDRSAQAVATAHT